MELQRLKLEIKEYEDNWEQDICPDFLVEEFIVKELVKLDTSTYNLSDLLSKKTLDMLIEYGVRHLNINRKKSRLTQIRDGKIEDLSYMAPLYQELFNKWEKAGWIKIDKKTFNDIKYSIELVI